eukprot:CAMPEP_0206276572 /NCGR_PEP_ID=MMETSP0047_2-20121206/36376_1 /ASSEMBLY_ACC=CAM_ASM_000192 /TAXON_ID=195065 /ORGANISM="Chroomonas mesostigmatica_cf, Strain CCMP1168" /LENGTH=171 /DNA_ID=CAMNT_0053706095 /DNA_START=67 /DNA_END=582 /DNA_ORIENTATION=-
MSSWSETLSDDVMKLAKASFDKYDHENAGTINVEDMVSALQEAGREVTETQVFSLLDEMGLSDGASGVRFHEFLNIIEQTRPAHSSKGGEDDQDAESFAASFQWLGGNPDDPESSITKEKIRKVLQDFELDNDVDKVLGAASPDAPNQRVLKANLNLEDLKDMFKSELDEA